MLLSGPKALALLLLTLLCGIGCSESTSNGAEDHAQAAPIQPVVTATAGMAVFAGGCFWCEADTFEHVPGVTEVVSGFTGGTTVKPTYEDVCGGDTGHAESILVRYDPAKITYEQLLTIYWHNIDPVSANGQFCDRGPQYRCAIFYVDDAQKSAADASRKALVDSHRFTQPITTEITKAGIFYPAENYHQHYSEKNPDHYHAYRTGCGRDRRLHEIWGDGK